jgi:hypothetical protein
MRLHSAGHKTGSRGHQCRKLPHQRDKAGPESDTASYGSTGEYVTAGPGLGAFTRTLNSAIRRGRGCGTIFWSRGDRNVYWLFLCFVTGLTRPTRGTMMIVGNAISGWFWLAPP